MAVQPVIRGGLHVDVPDVPAGLFPPIAGKMSKAVAQPVNAAASAALLFDIEDYDTDGTLVDIANERFVIPADAAGVYLITALLRWSEPNAGSGWLSTRVLINGGAGAPATRVSYAAVVTPWDRVSNEIATAVQLAAGDLVTFQVEQETGAQQSVTFAEATIQRVA